MIKETVVCVVIIMTIIIGDFFMYNHTKSVVEDMSGKLEAIEEKIRKVNESAQNVENKNDLEEIKEELKKIENEWNHKQKILAYYIEHDELEKVGNNIVGIKSNISMEDYTQAIENLEESKFVLKHIEEKYAFRLDNIF